MLARLIFFLTRKPTLLAIVVIWVCWLLWLWQPVQQVRLHQRDFLKAISKKDWEKAGRFISIAYADRWRHDKEAVVREGREVTFHFFWLKVTSLEEEISAKGPEGTVRARLRLEGMGDPVAEMAKQKVAEMTAPFEFDWKRTGMMPWSWELTRIDQAQLTIPRGEEW